MAVINVNQLTLKLANISEKDSKYLSQLITENLASLSIYSGSLYQIDTLKINVTAQPEASMEWLANQIVTDILQQINRTL